MKKKKQKEVKLYEEFGKLELIDNSHKDIIKTEGMCVLIYTDLFPMPYGIGWLERIVIGGECNMVRGEWGTVVLLCNKDGSPILDTYGNEKSEYFPRILDVAYYDCSEEAKRGHKEMVEKWSKYLKETELSLKGILKNIV